MFSYQFWVLGSEISQCIIRSRVGHNRVPCILFFFGEVRGSTGTSGGPSGGIGCLELTTLVAGTEISRVRRSIHSPYFLSSSFPTGKSKFSPIPLPAPLHREAAYARAEARLWWQPARASCWDTEYLVNCKWSVWLQLMTEATVWGFFKDSCYGWRRWVLLANVVSLG